MQKHILFVLFTLTLVVSGQLVTNTLTVVLGTNELALIQGAWQYDNGLRTNGVPPYTNVVASQTFRAFAENLNNTRMSQLAASFAVDLKGQRESEMLALWRAASVAKQNAAMNDLR